jgi:FkbM family methyltransferase
MSLSAFRHLRVLAFDRLLALLGHVPRHAVYCGDHRVLLRTAHGHKMFVDSRDHSVAPWLITDGVWEPWVVLAVLRQLRPGMRVVEVGANVGYFSILMGHAIGPAGRLTTFEANPAMADIVGANIRINLLHDRMTCVQKAASDTNGRLAFHRYTRMMGGSSLNDVSAIAAAMGDSIERLDVESVTLDAALDAAPVDFLKIDAEGAELRILQGAQAMIARSPNLRIVLEYVGGDYGAEILDLLRQHGFTARLIGRLGRLQSLSPAEWFAITASVDILAERARR